MSIPQIIYDVAAEEKYFTYSTVNIECRVPNCREKVVVMYQERHEDSDVFYFFCEDHNLMLEDCRGLIRIGKELGKNEACWSNG